MHFRDRALRRVLILVGTLTLALTTAALAGGSGPVSGAEKPLHKANAAEAGFGALFQEDGLDLGRAAIFGFNSVYLRRSAVVASGDVVANEASDGPTLASDVELTLDGGAETSRDYRVYANRVKLNDGSVIGGDLYADKIDGGGKVLGDIFSLRPPVYDRIPAFVSAPPEDPKNPPKDLSVPSAGVVRLDAGTYGDLQVGDRGVLVFIGGVYNFRDIRIGEKALVFFNGPTEIRVRDKFFTDKGGFFGPDPDAAISAADIVFYVEGVNGVSGELEAEPKSVEIAPSNDLFVNFYAPNGTIRLGDGVNAVGAYLGRDVDVGEGAEVALDSAFFNRAPLAEDDLLTVNSRETADTLDSFAGSLLDNDVDPEGDRMTVNVKAVTAPKEGKLTLGSDGSFSYAHNGGEVRTDFFVYEVCDDGLPSACSQATVFVDINLDGVILAIRKEGEGAGRVTSAPSGLDCGRDCIGAFARNSSVLLSADAEPGSVFVGWEGDGDCSDSILTPDKAKTCIAIFDVAPSEPEMFAVRVSKDGSGDGTVVSRPAGIDCGIDCSAVFPRNIPVELEAIPDAVSEFLGWDGDDDCRDGILSGETDARCVAVFNRLDIQPPKTFKLRVAVEGAGFVGSNPSGILCDRDCSALFPEDSVVQLSARASEGWFFVGWSGDCDSKSFFAEVSMDSDKVCVAAFEQER